MALKTLEDLFLHELKDLYSAEKQLVKALPKMAKAATSQDLRAALDAHLKETEEQVSRIEQAFELLNEPVKAKPCAGMEGIIEEGASVIKEEEKGPALDAAIIASGQRAEHYEIAAYGTLAYFAGLLGNDQAKALLGQTLEEEKMADRKLNDIAKSRVNRDALMSAGTDEMAESRRGSTRSSGRSRTAGRGKKR